MTNKENNNNLMWGGRFSENQDKILSTINASIDFDKRLYKQDLSVSIVHCEMLIKQKIISSEDGKNILSGLDKIKSEIENDKFNFSYELEDIHTHIE